MPTEKFRLQHLLMPGLAIVLLALISCSTSDDENEGDSSQDMQPGEMMPVDMMPDVDGATNFIVPLGPEQEVPPVTAAGASGEGNLMIDTVVGTISGIVNVSGLSGQAQAAHIHLEAAGNNGMIQIELSGNTNGTVWTVPENTVLNDVQLAALLVGRLYINVHTAMNSGGEIRGQIPVAGVIVRRTTLSGDQVVPPVIVNGGGMAVTTVVEATGDITTVVVTDGVIGANNVQIYQGGEGLVGPSIIRLDQDQQKANTWRTPAGAILSAGQVQLFIAGGLYVNVNTPVNNMGEVRGQL